MSENEMVIPAKLIMDTRLYGEIRAFHNGQEMNLGTERERKAFVALAADAPRPITREALVTWIWDEPPDGAPDELHRIMARLRGEFAKVGLRDVLISRNGLCRLDVPEDSVDVHRFGALLHRADAESDAQRRADLLREAVDLSSAIPLAGIRGQRIEAYRTRLLARHAEAQVALIGADIGLGRGAQHVVLLNELFREQPEDTRIAALSMLALHEASQRPAALRIYDEHREQLARAGLDVSQSVRDIQTRLLNTPDSVPLPTGVLDHEPAAIGGSAMPDATENPHDTDDDEEPRSGDAAAPIFGKLVQRAANINNVGNIRTETLHLGPRYHSADWDDDDE
jgi:DNA-binding SARP family transcriptional activator